MEIGGSTSTQWGMKGEGKLGELAESSSYISRLARPRPMTNDWSSLRRKESRKDMSHLPIWILMKNSILNLKIDQKTNCDIENLYKYLAEASYVGVVKTVWPKDACFVKMESKSGGKEERQIQD